MSGLQGRRSGRYRQGSQGWALLECGEYKNDRGMR